MNTLFRRYGCGDMEYYLTFYRIPRPLHPGLLFQLISLSSSAWLRLASALAPYPNRLDHRTRKL